MDGKIKKIGYSILSMIFFISVFACEDHKEDNLTPNRVYFPNDGENNLLIYDFGLDFDYSVGIYKSGYWNENASLEVRKMSNDELSSYLPDKEVKTLPDNLFSINNTRVELGKEERNAYVDITFYPKELHETLSSGEQFVLPLKIASSNMEINEQKNTILLYPEVRIPYTYFSQYGLQEFYVDGGGSSIITEEYPILINFDNESDITCHIEVAPDLLATYNEENQLSIELLPEAAYSFMSSQVIGTNQRSVSLEITLDRDLIEFGSDYILPLRISSISQLDTDERTINIDPDKSTALLHVDYFIPGLLNSPEWTVPYFSSQETQAGTVRRYASNVLDGDFSTSWHNKYSGGSAGLPEYVIIDMQKVHTISRVDIYRDGGRFRDTKAGKIYTSIDNVNYTEISDWRFPEPDTDSNHSLECIQEIKRTRARYVKIEVTESFRPLYCNITEIRIWGV